MRNHFFYLCAEALGLIRDRGRARAQHEAHRVRDPVPPAWQVARIVLVALILANAVASFWVAYANDHSGRAPFVADSLDPLHIVQRVEPGSEAARAGVHAGDRFLPEAMSVDDRHRASIGWTGRAVRYAMVDAHGRRYDVMLHRRDVPRDPTPSYYFFLAGDTVIMIMAAVVLWRRPGMMTVAFAYWTCASVMFATRTAFVVSAGLPDGLFTLVSSAIIVVAGPLPVVALLPFLARFPSGVVTGRRKLIAHAADVTFAAAAVVMYAVMLRGFPGTVRPAEAEAAALFTGVILFGGSVVLYARSDADQRRRLVWVLIGLVISATGYGFIGSPYNGPDHPVQRVAIWLSHIFFPLAVFYTILRHRLIDPSFALNRALVYGAVTALVVAGISLVDFAVGRFISESKVALALEAVAAVVIGFGLNWVHAGTEHIVERTLFRERHRVESQIEARITALDYAGEQATVDAALVPDVARLMKLGSAALFVRDAGVDCFVRCTSIGWDADRTTSISAEQFFIRALIATEHSAVLDSLGDTIDGFPVGDLAADLAIPVITGHELRAIALYGKRHGTVPLDPEELRLLERLAKAAATAYQRIEAAAWRRRAESLEASSVPPVRIT